MDTIELLPLISRWLHVLAATLLVGGTLFMRLALLPVMNVNPPNSGLQEGIRKHWSRWVMLSVLVLLISGLYNAYLKAIDFKLDVVYLSLLTLKIVLGLAVFYWVSLLSGRSERAVRFRNAGSKWYNLTCLAMIAVVLMAGYMKLSPQESKSQQESPQVTQAITISVSEQDAT